MTGPIRRRKIERLPVYRSFSPDDVTAVESIRMTVDEFEALGLLEGEGLTCQDAYRPHYGYGDLRQRKEENSRCPRSRQTVAHHRRLLRVRTGRDPSRVYGERIKDNENSGNL